jgi:tRNA-specific 2-thiouridylase
VLGTRPVRNEVVVGEAESLMRDEVRLGDLNWLAPAPATGERVEVRLRHRARRVPAVVANQDEDLVELRLERAQRAITPGQSGAIYRGDLLVGGGRIR